MPGATASTYAGIRHDVYAAAIDAGAALFAATRFAIFIIFISMPPMLPLSATLF